MLVEKTFDAGEVLINYVEGPDNGPPIIFLHGYTANWQSFIPLIPQILPRWHIYAIDYRGHGKSGRTKGNYRFRDYYRDVQKFIQEILESPPVILTHSLGGVMATMYAANYSEKVKALILLDPPMNFDYSLRNFVTQRHSLWVARKRIAGMDVSLRERIQAIGEVEINTATGKRIFKDIFDHGTLLGYAKVYGDIDPDVFTKRIQSHDTPDVFKEYSDGYDTGILYPLLKCPVFLLRANPKKGGIISDNDIARVQGLVEDLVYVFFEDLGHLMHLENPWSVQKVLIFILESLR
jgi:pimeloyl-ACP methyl ester carboxylesterase